MAVIMLQAGRQVGGQGKKPSAAIAAPCRAVSPPPARTKAHNSLTIAIDWKFCVLENVKALLLLLQVEALRSGGGAELAAPLKVPMVPELNCETTRTRCCAASLSTRHQTFRPLLLGRPSGLPAAQDCCSPL